MASRHPCSTVYVSNDFLAPHSAALDRPATRARRALHRHLPPHRFQDDHNLVLPRLHVLGQLHRQHPVRADHGRRGDRLHSASPFIRPAAPSFYPHPLTPSSPRPPPSPCPSAAVATSCQLVGRLRPRGWA